MSFKIQISLIDYFKRNYQISHTDAFEILNVALNDIYFSNKIWDLKYELSRFKHD